MIDFLRSREKRFYIRSKYSVNFFKVNNLLCVYSLLFQLILFTLFPKLIITWNFYAYITRV